MRIVVDTNVVNFIGCAVDSKALFIVSGDKDLLVLGDYDGIEMITAADFCERYL